MHASLGILAVLASLAQPVASSTLPISSALNTADRDAACPACQDFNRFANGGWIDKTAIPPGRSSWSTYDEVGANVRHDLDAIIAEGVAAAHAGRTEDLAKIGTYYSTCMDLPMADRLGMDPVRADLAQVDAIRGPSD